MSAEKEAGHDPIMATFDAGVALLAYGLLFTGIATLGVTALAGMALAHAHRDDSHSMVRSHYRFQVRIFWTTVICTVIAVALAIGAGGLAFGGFYAWLRGMFPEIVWREAGFFTGPYARQEEAWLVIGALLFGLGGALYMPLASVYGAIKLVGARPIRHRGSA